MDQYVIAIVSKEEGFSIPNSPGVNPENLVKHSKSPVIK